MGLFNRAKGAVRAEIDESIVHGRTTRESKEAYRAQTGADASLGSLLVVPMVPDLAKCLAQAQG